MRVTSVQADCADQLREPGLALPAVGGAHPDLDQLVVLQRLDGLGHARCRSGPFWPEHHHGLERVGLAAEEPELFFTEGHAGHYP